MSDNKKAAKIVSPLGEAVWPNLNTPDTKYNAMGEYNTKLRLDPSDEPVQKFIALLEELVAESYQKAKDENPKFAKIIKSVSPVKPELDDNGDETGNVIVNFKQAAKVQSKKTGKEYTFSVALYDASLANLPKSVIVGGGSKIRVSFEPFPYFNAKDKEAGVSMRLVAVQVVELRERQARDGAAFGFAATDGFSAVESVMGEDAPKGNGDF
jgi:hypothetical protein